MSGPARVDRWQHLVEVSFALRQRGKEQLEPVLDDLLEVFPASLDPVEDFEVISRELELFAGSSDDTAVALAAKPQLAAANKIDAIDEPERLTTLRAHLSARGVELFPISAVTGEGVPALLEAMWRMVAAGHANPVT